MLELDIAYLRTKFNHYSFTYGDMVGAHQNLNGSRNLTTSLSGMTCHGQHLLRSTYPSNLNFLSSPTTRY